MLYLIIPLSIFAAALLVVMGIVVRKMSYLRKLTPESHEVGDTMLHDFAPEVVDWLRGVPWRQYLHQTLVRIERSLLQARRAMSAVDRASIQVMQKVRRVGQQTARSHEVAVAQLEAEKQEKIQERDPDDIDLNDPEQLKAEEQRLIIAIAQNPKDPKLLSDLARVYMKMENFSDAAEALNAALRLDPENENFKKRLESAEKRKEQAAAEANKNIES